MSEAATLTPASPSVFDASAAKAFGDQIIINGVSIGLDEIVDEAIFAPKRIEALREAFANAKPFQHLVIDGLFSPKLLELVLADFDRLNWSDWRRYDTQYEVKRGSAPKTWLGHASQLYFNTIYSGRFVDFLERVADIAGLVTDPELFAGGLHDIPPGGKFAMHIDFNQHAVTRLDNRLVFITYLNKDWQSSYGGGLELRNIEGDEESAVEIVPEFGRSALFYQSSKSLHGHPKAVDAPNGRHRRSAAAYFYSNGRPDDDGQEFHTTQFVKTADPPKHEKLTNIAKYLLPPVLVDGVRKAMGMLR
jgi:hypothetical protein